MQQGVSLLRISLERILLLYDEALISLKRATAAVSAGEPDLKAESLSKALAAVMELKSGLDHSQSPILTRNLEDLYSYSINRIYAGNNLNDSEPIEEAVKVLEVLRSGWRDIRPEVTS